MAVASQPVQLLAIHSANVTPMTPSTFQSSASSLPTARPFSSMQAMVAAEMGSGRNTSVTDSQHATSSTSAMGMQMAVQSRNDISMPVLAASTFMAMMFMALPDGMDCPPTTDAYVMPIMSARPRLDLPGSHPSILRMLDTAIPANSAVQGRSEMKNDSTAADTMNAPTVARALPFVRRMSANTIFVGSFVLSSAAVIPNDARMKKITLLMNPLHTPPLNSSTPKAGMSTIMTRPEMATGTGSVTHRKMPATMSASDIFPASESPSGVGPNHAAAINATATATQATLLAAEPPASAWLRFALRPFSPIEYLPLARRALEQAPTIT